jgi:hypothetical protein
MAVRIKHETDIMELTTRDKATFTLENEHGLHVNVIGEIKVLKIKVRTPGVELSFDGKQVWEFLMGAGMDRD